jgi:hypothetical protein
MRESRPFVNSSSVLRRFFAQNLSPSVDVRRCRQHSVKEGGHDECAEPSLVYPDGANPA